MRHISRLTLSFVALALAGALGASGPAWAQGEAPKPKAEDSAEPKREENKETKREEKTEKRDDKAEARSEQKAKATRDDKSAEKVTEKKSRADSAAYMRRLGQLIRARSPGVTSLGSGSAVVRFRLGASGAPNSVTIVSASTPKHGELARSIVSGLRAPPPPGGAYDGMQSFRFH
ncbi:MAG: hypothetical protein FJX45_16050 [Alphaproteobacteria bacterium]|nr:hypothetical protein [Alphaproteobacteria bacterium]MBM3654055.1 hypothetical protein [Alphaproteobacteria bacterium]